MCPVRRGATSGQQAGLGEQEGPGADGDHTIGLGRQLADAAHQLRVGGGRTRPAGHQQCVSWSDVVDVGVG
jgi:hypothetical protein